MPLLSLLKSYKTLAFFGPAAAAGGGGGGGGGALADALDELRECEAATAATGWGTALGVGVGCAAAGWGVGCGTARRSGAGLDASFEGPPPGPPGRRSLPVVTGRAATCFPRGVGLDTEFGGSPEPVWIAPLL